MLDNKLVQMYRNFETNMLLFAGMICSACGWCTTYVIDRLDTLSAKVQASYSSVGTEQIITHTSFLGYNMNEWETFWSIMFLSICIISILRYMYSD